jgi:hypothetical protein
VVLAVVGGLGICLVAGLLTSLVSPVGAQYPASWDRRVVKAVDFVESVRGRAFKHPVRVYFLTPQEYTLATNRMNGSGAEGEHPGPSAKQGEAAQQADRRSNAEQRAFGVLQGEPKLDEASAQLMDSGTLAFYDTDRDVVNVRGTDVTVEVEATLVHELTHALQDQHHDIEKLFGDGDSERSQVARAILEGDALAVERAYVDRLSPERRSEYETKNSDQVTQSRENVKEVPGLLTATLAMPYALGGPFVRLADAGSNGGGTTDLAIADQLLDNLPKSAAVVFNPGAPDQAPVTVDPPKDAQVSSGEQFDKGTLGAFALYLVLAARVEPKVAMKAVDGWRGDAFVAKEQGSGDGRKVCVGASVAVATDEAAANLEAALVAWVAAMPHEAGATQHRDGTTVRFTSCDPGPEVDLKIPADYLATISVPAARLEIAAELAPQTGRDAAVCVASRVIDRLTPDELQADEPDPVLLDKVRREVTAAAVACK